MKVLVVGKFPPIQGGVSAHNFWVCRALTELGHEVSVATNADEVEPEFRLALLPSDAPWMAAARLRVTSTVSLAHQSFIPWAEPHLSKIFGICLQLIESHRPDLIYASYFEPFGLAATLAGRLTNIPVFLRHAGSDLGRLSQHPQLKRSYAWMLENVTALVSPLVRELRLQFDGKYTPAVAMMPAPRLPDVYFLPKGRFPFEEYLRASSSGLSTTRSVGRGDTGFPHLRAMKDSPDKSVITIGAYGKVGEAKGSFDLAIALSALAREGLKFNFFALVAGRNSAVQKLHSIIDQHTELRNQTWILPSVGPWRIPDFLGTCDIVAFLERNFPVGFHGPQVPREVLATEASLITSGEIARKPEYAGSLCHGENVYIVEDPRDVEGLRDGLRELIMDAELRRRLSAQGRYLSRFWEGGMPTYRESVSLFLNRVESFL